MTVFLEVEPKSFSLQQEKLWLWGNYDYEMTALQSYLFAPEVMDICANACEKHWVNASNSQLVCPSLKICSSLKLFIIQCAQLIKEALDSR